MRNYLPLLLAGGAIMFLASGDDKPRERVQARPQPMPRRQPETFFTRPVQQPAPQPAPQPVPVAAKPKTNGVAGHAEPAPEIVVQENPS